MEEHRPKKLLDQVHDAIRLKHYSILIEETYVNAAHLPWKLFSYRVSLSKC
jgi:hypothetical protein